MISYPPLRAFSDAIELMAPVLFKSLGPIMHQFQLLGLKLIQTLLTVFADRNQAHLAQHAQVLRDSRLRHSQSHHESADRESPAPGEQFEDLTALWFRDGVENVAGSRSTGHALNIFSYGNISSGRRGRFERFERDSYPGRLSTARIDKELDTC